MRRSPSKSNSNFAVPNSTNSSNSSNQQQLTTPSDDLNTNEPNDPDDSRSSSTIKQQNYTNISINETTGEFQLKYKQKNHKRSASPAPQLLTNPNNVGIPIQKKSEADHHHHNRQNAKLFSIPTPKPSTAITIPQSPRLIASDFSSVSSFSSSNFSSYATSSASSYMKFSSISSQSTTSSLPSPTSSTDKSKKSKSKKPIFLKRYPSDSSSNEGINIDDTIKKLISMNDTTRFLKKSDLSSSNKRKKNNSFPFHSWEIQLICAYAREIMMNQPTLLRLQSSIKIVGDIHGQFNDLLRIFKLSGSPSETNFLFLGDYVDRGKQSLETILLLLCYKIKYKDNFFMLRGNHESANVTKMYGFYDECKRRKNTKIWKSFIDVFNTLPLAAIIQDKIFCVHGGISPELNNLRQFDSISRPTDIPDEGLLTDLLWSDPDSSVNNWALNDRGVSYTFSKRNVLDFCSKFKFDLIIRGHMVVEDGYEFFAKKKLVTVFSAPNYCGQFQNWGAVLSITTGLMCSFELLKPHSIKKK